MTATMGVKELIAARLVTPTDLVFFQGDGVKPLYSYVEHLERALNEVKLRQRDELDLVGRRTATD